MFDSIPIIVAMFFWLSYVPIAILSLYRVINNRSRFVEKQVVADVASAADNGRTHHDAAAIIFQITTRSATKTHVVKRGVESILEAAHKVGYYNYQISVVTDDPEDARTLKGMKCEVVVVDPAFQTNAIRKGRALQYAVEHRRRTKRNGEKYWIFHMDDESFVTPQTILALLKATERDELASEGPIFYPLKFESANRLTALAESIRPFACYDCVSQMTNPPPLHMHGSNLLVRSDVEDTIEWKFGPTLAEDQMFGYKVYEKYGPGSMGWHGGELLEQPPLNIRDHFFQRRRWVLGTLQNGNKFPIWHRFKLLYKSVTYFLGFASAVASTAFAAYNYIPAILSPSTYMSNIEKTLASFTLQQAAIDPVEIGIGAILMFTSVVWLLSYQLGLYLNLRYSDIGWKKRLKYHFQTLILCPIIGLVETFPAFWAMIEYNVKKNKAEEKIPVYDFYVVSK